MLCDAKWLCGELEDDALQTTESPCHSTTTPYYKVLLPTAPYFIALQSITLYYKILQSTTKYYIAPATKSTTPTSLRLFSTLYSTRLFSILLILFYSTVLYSTLLYSILLYSVPESFEQAHETPFFCNFHNTIQPQIVS